MVPGDTASWIDAGSEQDRPLRVGPTAIEEIVQSRPLAPDYDLRRSLSTSALLCWIFVSDPSKLGSRLSASMPSEDANFSRGDWTGRTFQTTHWFCEVGCLVSSPSQTQCFGGTGPPPWRPPAGQAS